MEHGYVLTVLMGVVALLFFVSLLVDFAGRRKYLGRPSRFESLPRGVPFRVVEEVDLRCVSYTWIQELVLENDVTRERLYAERIVEGTEHGVSANYALPEVPFVLLGYGKDTRIEEAWVQHSLTDRW